ncbi:MAG: siroheme synthase CysG [Geminicoccaceae bacterium]
MRHFPIFIDLQGQRVVVAGSGETALAKLRLILKTEAEIVVVGSDAHSEIRQWAGLERLQLIERRLEAGDLVGARLVYAANDDPLEDARVADLGRDAGALVNIVDNLSDSQFITPAIVDRDPVTVAIGTEGAAPVLARRIKADLEEQLSAGLGPLARIAKSYRHRLDGFPGGAARRHFWARYYEELGPRALRAGGEEAVLEVLDRLASTTDWDTPSRGHVAIIGAGPGDAELLVQKARRLLHEADVVIHDRLVSNDVLELARREALRVEVGKTPFGESWSQDDINALIVEHARKGALVVRLKSGDPAIFGRLDEEMDALDWAGIDFEIVPGITSAMAAAARLQVSLTKRRRNSSLRILTGHDIDGMAEHDWRELAKPGAVACIYMGVRAARFLQGRLMLFGAAPQTPMTVVENVSRADEKILSATLADLPQRLRDNDINGPAIIFLGLSPRRALVQLELHEQQLAEGI